MKKGVKRTLKITGIVLGIIVVIVALVAIFISPVAKYVIEKHSKEWTGRQILMDDLSINLFNGSLDAANLRMKERDDKTDFVKFDTLKVAINPFKLLKKEINIRYITLDAPSVRIIQYDSTFNFTDLTKLGDKDDDKEEDKDDSEPWAVGIYNIKLNNGVLSYRDDVRSSQWNLNNLFLDIPGVYFSGKATNAGVSFKFAEGGSLTTKAQYDMDRGRYDVQVQLQGLAIDNFMPYIKDFLNVSDVNGVLGGDIHVNGSSQTPTDVDITGDVSIKDFAAYDLNKAKIASISSLTTKVNRINPKDGVCDIENVTVDRLSTHFDMYKDHNNFSNLMKPEDKSKEVEESSSTDTVSSKPMVVSIKNVEVRNSEFAFSDNTLRMPFKYKLNNINIKSKDFSPSASRNSAHMSFETQGGGNAMIDWKGSMENINNQSLTILFKHIDMKQFTPYSMEYFAYPLEKGKLSIVSQNVVTNGNLVGRNSIDIYNCRVGNKDKSLKTEFNIPLKTGLYILRDKDDKILLDLPVKGDVNSPEFSYKKLIFKTLGNLMVKLAVSPFSALASGLGIKPDELSSVPFDAMKPDLTQEEYARVDKIISAQQSKPEMIIKMTQRINVKNSVKQRSIFEMKRRYYISKHPEVAGRRLSLIDFGSINDIKDNDEGLRSFVKNLSPVDGSLAEQAEVIYPTDSAETSLYRQMSFRDKLVSDYMLKQGVPAEKLSITSMPIDSLKSYKGADKYSVNFNMGEEQAIAK